MSEAAEGVAFCRTGRPITGLEGTKGNVEDLGSEAPDGLFASSLLEEFQGNVLVFDNKGMALELVGNVTDVVTGDLTTASTFLLLSTSSFSLGLGGGGGGACFFLVGEVSDVGELAALPTLLISALLSFLAASSAVLRLFALWLVEAKEGIVKALVRPAKEELWGKANLGSVVYCTLFL